MDMDFANVYTTIAMAILATVAIVIYFFRSGRELERRTNDIIREKSPLISGKYKEVIEDIFIGFKTSRTLTRRQEDRLEGISYARVMLTELPNELSEVVDKLAYSLPYAVSTALSLIVFGYLITYTFSLDPTTHLALLVLSGAFGFSSFIKYSSDGITKIRTLREFEKRVNKIDRCETFEELYDSL